MSTWTTLSPQACWIGQESLTKLLLASLWPSLACSILLCALAYELYRHTLVRSFIALIAQGTWTTMYNALKQTAVYASNLTHQSLLPLRKSQITGSATKVVGLMVIVLSAFAAGGWNEHRRLSSAVGEWNCFYMTPRPIGQYEFSGLFAGQWIDIDVCPDYVPPLDLRKSGTVLMSRMRFTDRGDCISLNPKLGNWYKIAKQEDCRYVRIASNE